ncbi:hypothetical protein [Nocardioides currus]|nr:hypothetical protein [Nocardioides currus]
MTTTPSAPQPPDPEVVPAGDPLPTEPGEPVVDPDPSTGPQVVPAPDPV